MFDLLTAAWASRNGAAGARAFLLLWDPASRCSDSHVWDVSSPIPFRVLSSHCICICICVYNMFPVPGSVPLPPMLWYPKIYHLHAICSISASHLHAICSVSEPQPPTCTLFAAFESHMLPTYDLHAVHSIYVFLFYLVYLYTSQAIVCLFIYIYIYVYILLIGCLWFVHYLCSIHI